MKHIHIHINLLTIIAVTYQIENLETYKKLNVSMYMYIDVCILDLYLSTIGIAPTERN